MTKYMVNVDKGIGENPLGTVLEIKKLSPETEELIKKQHLLSENPVEPKKAKRGRK